MGKGILAESQGGMPIAKIIAGNDGAIGSNFSPQMVSLVPFSWGRCSSASSLIHWGQILTSQSRFCIVKPAPHHRMLTVPPDGCRFLFDQIGHSRPVLCTDGMTCCRSSGSLLGIPAAGSQVQGGYYFSFCLLKS